MEADPWFVDRKLWAGYVDLERRGGTVTPWRGRIADADLYAHELIRPVTIPAGVRFTGVSDTRTLTMTFAEPSSLEDPSYTDLLVDGRVHQRRLLGLDEVSVTFDDIPAGTHRLEVYLPMFPRVQVTGVAIDPGATFEPYDDPRPKWVTHGSSITMCRGAGYPTAAWPALVAQALDLNHTNLGFAGQCKVETLVARAIAGLPADAISVCLGINVHHGDLSPRTFRAAAAGFLLTVRDGHPDVPLVVCSPICSPPRETTPGKTGLTLVQMRDDLRSLVDALRTRGDRNIHYVNGLDLLGHDDAHLMPDALHPHREGYAHLAKQFLRHAAPLLGFTAAAEPVAS